MTEKEKFPLKGLNQDQINDYFQNQVQGSSDHSLGPSQSGHPDCPLQCPSSGIRIPEQDWQGSRDNWYDAFQNYLSIKHAKIRAPIIPARKFDEVLHHELLVKTQSWKKNSGKF